MAGSSQVEIKVTADTKDAERGLDDVDGKLKDLGGKKGDDGGAGGGMLDAIKEKAGAVAAALGRAAVAGAAATVSAVTAIGGAALSAYASYEQLVGGVDTLFGSASKRVQGYASKAYLTANLSANAYMEQVTSFSASLVSSLGGDTKRAADLGNQAVVDMADNANKMGSNLTDIQNAYQGFAKQNYTMLDNLKLGYGGTQAEMQRLLDDAEKITGKKYKLGNFADMVEAIHAVQSEMGITGTTAEEALHTIEGSVNTCKAAWENWLTGLGNSDVDMGELTTQLMEALGAVAENVIPRVATIGAAIVENLPAALSGLTETLAPVLAEALSTAWGLAGKALSGLGIELPEVDASQVMDAFGKVMEVAQGFAEQLAPLGGALVDCLGAIAPVLEPLGGVAEGVLGLLGSLLQGVGESFGEYVAPALERLSDAFGLVLGAAQPVIELLQPVAEFLGQAFGEAVSVVIDVLTLALDVLSPIINAIGQFASFLQEIPGAAQEFANGFQAVMQALPGIAQELLGMVVQAVVQWASDLVARASSAATGFVNGVRDGLASIGSTVSGALQGAVASAQRFASDMGAKASAAARDFGSKLQGGLQSLPSRVADVGRQIVEGIANGIRNAADSVVKALTGAVDGAIAGAKKLLGIASPSKVFRDQVGRWIPLGAAEGIEEEAGALRDSVADAFSFDLGSLGVSQQLSLAGAAPSGPTYSLVVDGSAVLTDGRVNRTIERFFDDMQRLGAMNLG